MRDFKEGMNMWMNRYDRILFYELTDKLRLTLITDQRKRKKKSVMRASLKPMCKEVFSAVSRLSTGFIRIVRDYV